MFMARLSVFAALVVFIGGCTGSIMPSGEDDPGPPDLPVCEDESCLPAQAPVVLRRLNRREYWHSVSDLFGDAARSAEASTRLPPDGRNLLGFDNEGSVLNLAEGDFDAYYETAISVASALEAAGELPFATCQGSVGSELHACIRAALPAFLQRAMRREVSANTLAQTAMLAEEENAYPGAVRNVVLATLISPYFVFHYETPDAERSEGIIDSYEVADRLSYFLWSTTPDETLLSLASGGELRDEGVLRAQAARLLSDDRSERFIREFLAQWLGLDRFVAEAPEESRALFADMREETLRLGVHLLTSGEPIARLVDSDVTLVSARLAEHYGIDFPSGDEDFRLVTLPPERRGLMTHGSILASLSPDVETNPFHRGYAIASRFTCIDPPPAPPDVGALGSPQPGGTIRDVVEEHRANPTCAGCHRLFDHIGLAVEEFDWMGLHRTEYPGGEPVDPTGQLGDGVSFESTAELATLLGARQEFSDCFARRVVGYAMGGVLEDQRLENMLRRVREEAADEDLRLVDIVTAVITSPEFKGDAQ